MKLNTSTLMVKLWNKTDPQNEHVIDAECNNT